MNVKLWLFVKVIIIAGFAFVAAERAAVRFGGFSGVQWVQNKIQAIPEPSSIGKGAKDGFENEPLFHPRLLEIAGRYKSYGRLLETLRWGPHPCAGPIPVLPSQAQFSASDIADSHGRKLYYLFVKRQDEYAWMDRPVVGGEIVQPVGQVIVKEAWQPVPAHDDAEGEIVGDPKSGHAVVPHARDPETKKLFRTGEPRGLFIMYKLDPQTPGTDRGWVYGTVTADGKRVTSAGNVSHCANRHRESKIDRMLAPPADNRGY